MSTLLLWWTIGSGTEDRFQSEMISFLWSMIFPRWSSYLNSHKFMYLAQITRLWGSYINRLSFHSFIRWQEKKNNFLLISEKLTFLSYPFVSIRHLLIGNLHRCLLIISNSTSILSFPYFAIAAGCLASARYCSACPHSSIPIVMWVLCPRLLPTIG
jgi:hypothetical protein